MASTILQLCWTILFQMESNLLAYLGVEMIPESAQEEDQHESQGVQNQQLVQDGSHTSNPIDNVPCEREEVVLSDTCIRCGDCDKVFSTKSNLNRHRKVHTGNMIPCTLCNKTFIVSTTCKGTEIPPTTIINLSVILPLAPKLLSLSLGWKITN